MMTRISSIDKNKVNFFKFSKFNFDMKEGIFELRRGDWPWRQCAVK